jgi:hypothetical protein
MDTLRHRLGTTAAGVLAIVAALAALTTSPGGSLSAGAVNAPQATVVSAHPWAKTPYVLDGFVYAIAPSTTKVFVGGNFTTVKDAGSAPKQNIVNLFAFDKATGKLDTAWRPKVDGQINALAASADGRYVYLAGRFKTVNGTAMANLAKVDATTGALISTFTPGVNGWVETMKLNGSKIYIGGYFSKERGVPAVSLGRVDATTGKPDATFNLPVTQPIKGSARVNALDVSADGSRLVITGNFLQVAGQARSQVAVIDLTTSPASLANWQTTRFGANDCSSSFDTYTRDVDISPDGAYFAVVATGAWRGTGTMCDTASRWELTASGTGIQPTWVDFTGGDTLSAVAVTNAAVYVGGHQRWLNNANIQVESKGPDALDRSGLGALDPQNGVPLTWNPGRDRGVGVFDMVATDDGLYIGHDTNNVAGEWHPRLTYFPLAGGTANPVRTPAALPGDLYSLDGAGNLTARSFDGANLGTNRTVPVGTSLSTVRGAFLLDGQLYTVRSDGHLYAQSFDGATGTLGAATDLKSWTAFSNITGLFYDSGRIYYTRSGDSRLFYRYFATESSVVGSLEFTVANPFNLSTVRGMTVASGNLFAATSDGNLHRIAFTGGAPSGTDTVVSGPAVDGRNFAGNGLFVGPATTAPATQTMIKK